jgi:hypothetical protein
MAAEALELVPASSTHRLASPSSASHVSPSELVVAATMGDGGNDAPKGLAWSTRVLPSVFLARSRC